MTLTNPIHPYDTIQERGCQLTLLSHRVASLVAWASTRTSIVTAQSQSRRYICMCLCFGKGDMRL